MNNFKQKILISIILALGLAFSANQAVLAVDNLVVEFEKTPSLFSETNFLPGNDVSRWVKVANYSGQSQRIATEAINYPNPMPADDLSKALVFVIKEGATDLYGGSSPTGPKTLFDFYQDSQNYQEISLSDLANGADTQYDFVISFPSGGENKWQNATTTFDILVGFQQGNSPLPPSPPVPPTGSGNGGGGGAILPPGLTILDESVTTTVSDQCQATVYWSTTYFSTSQVIYAIEGGNHILDLVNATGTPLRYGYDFTTPEYNVNPKVTGHQVTLYGLTSGATYYYRAVSHASPASVSLQHSFVMCPCSQQNQINEPITAGEPLAFNNNVSNQANVLGESQEAAGANENPAQDNASTTVLGDKADNSNFLANISSFFGKGFACLKCLPWWLGIILALLSLQKIVWLFRKAKKEQDLALKNKLKNAGIAWVVIGAASLAATLIFYLTKACFYWWLIIIFFALHILIYQFMVPQKGEQKRKISYFAIFQIIILVLAIIFGVIKTCVWVWLIILILAIIFVNNKK